MSKEYNDIDDLFSGISKKIDTIQEEINNLKQKFTDEKPQEYNRYISDGNYMHVGIIDKRPQEYKRWRANKNSMYLNICGGISTWRWDTRNRDDDESYVTGNYFETKPEVERVIAKLKAYQTIKDDAKGYRWGAGDKNYYISYDADDYLGVDNSPWSKDFGQVYFASREDAERSLKIHRKEWGLLYDLDEEENERNKV